MCGIIAYLGNTDGTESILLGLSLLQNRGYDSVGLSSIINSQLQTIKMASTTTYDAMNLLTNQVHQLQLERTILIAHTRWATHGGKTDVNAHPHHDTLDRIAVVHNGIIENYTTLKKELVEKGYTFRSQTDTEVISILVGTYLDQGCSMEESIRNTISRLQGSWALLFLHKDFPEQLWLTRNGSPLLLGIENEICMVASEAIAFGTSIRNYMVVENHDIVSVKRNGTTFELSPLVQHYSRRVREINKLSVSPQGYPHWMIQEIMEQPESIMRAINYGGRIKDDTSVKLGGLESCVEKLQGVEHIVLVGCGTSYHAALWSRSLFTSLEMMHTVSVYDGAEFSIHDIPRHGKTVMIVLSQSGETKDVYRCLQIAYEHQMISIGVVNVVDSIIARETDCGVYVNAGREVAVASTKSFTSQCIILSLIAIWFSQQHNTCIEKRRRIISDLRSLSYHVHSVLQQRLLIKEITESLTKATSIFILGKGSDEAIAKEGSLKIKEIVYVHAEGYSSSALKHGPLALLEESVPVLLLDTKLEFHDKIINAYHEVHARHSRVIMITNKEELNYPDMIRIPKNDTFGGVLANIVIQLLGYEWSIHKGYSPDFPRNLAKVVTVE